LSPALENIDSSSGAIGTAVNHAIAELVPLIAKAPADRTTREAWLERLWAAHEADEIPYIETLADYWGELCASNELASAWADRLLGTTRMALSPDTSLRGHFHGTDACLSALYRAERYAEIVDILQADTIWPYKRWAVRALAAMGRKAEAIRYAESCRGRWADDGEVDVACEEILLSSGRVEDAYERYGPRASRAGTYLATYRAVVRKYPHKAPCDILNDLVKTTPGDEGKWFAAAKEAGLYDEALALASRADLGAFVLAGRGQRLFVRRKRDRAREERAKAAALVRLLRRPDGVADFLEEARTKLLQGIAQARRAPPPPPTEHWAVAGGYQGVEQAQLVVVNIRAEAERPRADELVADVGRLRKEAGLFHDILGSRGTRIPVTAVVANLADPRDRGTGKALARVRRAARVTP
jgi:hypothetical protein